MRVIQLLELALDPRLQRLAQRVALLLKARLSVPMVVAVVGVMMLAWVLLGVRLRGGSLLLWLLVPAFVFAACFCIGGPDRLFDKDKHEGRVVLQFARKDALTLLDVVGLGLATVGVLLALALIGWRLRAMRQLTME